MVQVISLEIHFVKTNVGRETLRWRLYLALNPMLYISKGLRRVLTSRSQELGAGWRKLMRDDCLKSNLKSAGVQLLSMVKEVRERGMDGY